MPGLPSKINTEEPAHSLYEGIEYREFWSGPQQRIMDELEHVIVRNILPVSGHRIIDVGCGYGRLADCYMDRFQQVIMVDGSMSLLRQAYKETGGKAIYIAADVMHLPFRTASFDVVLMIRVFHHIQDSSACLSQLHRLLCDNGRFVFTYRNKQNMLKVIQWLIGVHKENPFTKEPTGLRSTLICHNPEAVHQLLCEHGFLNIKYYGTGVLDWLASRIRLVRKWTNLGKSLAPFFGSSKIAPWILCSAIASGNTSIMEAKGISDILQCPSCGSTVSDEWQGYQCIKCKKYYPIKDGILDLRWQVGRCN